MNYIEHDNVNKSKGDAESFIYLLRFLAPWKRTYFLGFILLTIGTSLGTLGAYFLSDLIDKGFMAKNYTYAIYISTIIIIAEATALLFLYFGRKKIITASSFTILSIREKMFDHIHNLPLKYYDKQPQGRVVTRLTHDVEGLDQFFSNTLGKMIHLFLFTFSAFIAIIFTDITIGIAIFISIIPGLYLTYHSRIPTRELNREMAKTNASTNAQLSEFLNGLPIIRKFAIEQWSKNIFSSKVQAYLDACVKINRYNSYVRPLIAVLCHLPHLCLVALGGYAVLNGAMTIGIFAAYYRYCDRFSMPIMEISREINLIQEAFTNSERIAHFLQAEDEDTALGKDGDLIAENLHRTLTFDKVSMHYEENTPVLNEVSFSVTPGEKIGFLGQTGSGKTTTLSLLSRLYDFQHGEIRFGNTNIRDFNRNSLRKRIGFVSQDVVIFSGTLLENISAGQDITIEQANSAAEKTGLMNVLKKRNMTFYSEILDQGANLSIGERQLVALTRIFLQEPDILILDEATANIDPYYESLIHKAVMETMSDKTCLIIAHRLDTLKQCDRLLVFKNGTIVQQGTHEEIHQEGTYYYDLLHKNNQSTVSKEE